MLRVNIYILTIVFIFSVSCTQLPKQQEKIKISRGSDKVSKIVLIKRKNEGLFASNRNHLIKCLSEKLNIKKNLIVVNENQFRNAMYPFFESNDATINLEPSIEILKDNNFERKIKKSDIDYLIWLSEETKYGDKVGALSCSLGLYGAGCFGYTNQADITNVKAEIWSVSGKKMLSNDSVTTKGQSQLIAFVVPIPIPSDSHLRSCKVLSQKLLNKLLNN